LPINEQEKIYLNAKKYNIPLHIDGARIFNAATCLNVDVKEVAKHSDSIMFCLSKGLCSPVGSILLGTKEFIIKARKNRKLMGGGMRQVGVIAAPGIVSLTKMTKRLNDDHIKAKMLAEPLSNFVIIDIDLNTIQINMIFIRIKSNKPKIEDRFVDLLKENGITTYYAENKQLRFVMHNDVSLDDVKTIIKKLPVVISKL